MSVPDRPQCSWVPVVDGTGRRRLEMRWDQPRTAPAFAVRGRTAAGTRAA
jgi:hypothetical protein